MQSYWRYAQIQGVVRPSGIGTLSVDLMLDKYYTMQRYGVIGNVEIPLVAFLEIYTVSDVPKKKQGRSLMV